MLYVTTRNKHDVYTAHRTLNQERTGDGGLFVPFKMPEFSPEEIGALAGSSFGQNVAEVLNLFFGTKLTGWDVDVTVGRSPVKLRPMSQRILAGELWHNLDGTFDRFVENMAARIHPDGEYIGKPVNWLQVSVRIAVLFGLFGELIRTGQLTPGKKMDVAVATGSFEAPMAVWYARQMGLPIGTIVCGCNENGAVWDLLHHGEVDTGITAVSTTTPEADFAIAPDLERLICGTIGQDEVMSFWWSCTEGMVYAPNEENYRLLRQGMFAAVVSKARVESILPSVYRTNRYVLDLYAALAYGALLDYRSRTGTAATALLLTEKSPLCNACAVCSAMGITNDELKRRLAEG